jgi:predicted nucleic acid-binding protein
MNEYLVDTNVVLDVIVADPVFGVRSRAMLERLAENGVLVINPVIYAEVGAFADSLKELDELLPAGLFRRDTLTWEASFLAGQAFRRYRRQGGRKGRGLPDFLIGAHAATAGFALVTRDQGHARYFKLNVLDPSSD